MRLELLRKRYVMMLVTTSLSRTLPLFDFFHVLIKTQYCLCASSLQVANDSVGGFLRCFLNRLDRSVSEGHAPSKIRTAVVRVRALELFNSRATVDTNVELLADLDGSLETALVS